MTPSEAVIFRTQVAESTARHFHERGHRIADDVTRRMASLSITHLRQAELFVWRQDLLRAALSAARTLPSPVTMTSDIKPCERGLYLFDAPVEIDGCAKPVCAVGWMSIADYTGFWVYVITAGTSWADIGMMAAFASFMIKEGTAVTAGHGFVDHRDRTTDVEFNSQSGSDSVLRFILASWLWLRQKVMSAPAVQPNRAARRVAERAEVIPSVNVVVLRRRDASGNSGDEREVEWSCQWLVRGHWRQQYYRSTGEHRPVWIEPYVKGPEDKPFRAPAETVFAVNR